MADLASEISELKTDFQRIADRFAWVRASFTLNRGRFELFSFGHPGSDGVNGAILVGMRGDQELAVTTDLFELTERAGTIVGQFLKSCGTLRHLLCEKSIHYDLKTPWELWLMFLVHSRSTALLCHTQTDGECTPAVYHVADNDACILIDYYPQVCLTALSGLRNDLQSTERALSSDSRQCQTPSTEPASIGENDPRDKWLRKGPLGLILNTNTHVAERDGQRAEFGASRLAWEVFMALIKRDQARYSCRDLGHDVWNPSGNEYDPDENTVQKTIGRVKTIIKPLGLTVNCSRATGYILAELKATAEQESDSSRAKRKSRRRKPR